MPALQLLSTSYDSKLNILEFRTDVCLQNKQLDLLLMIIIVTCRAIANITLRMRPVSYYSVIRRAERLVDWRTNNGQHEIINNCVICLKCLCCFQTMTYIECPACLCFTLNEGKTGHVKTNHRKPLLVLFCNIIPTIEMALYSISWT